MTLQNADNIIAALGQSNRVCEVFLMDLADWQMEKVLATMQVPFPELTKLGFWLNNERPAIPDSFLDGSAPRLLHFELDGVPFPGLPSLLLSANHLVHLELYNIPPSGYISSEAMVTPLSVLTSLETLILQFQPLRPPSFPGWGSQILPPRKRSILPALDRFYFQGVTNYLEDLVTFFDAPQLETLDATFFNQINFNCPRLARFINCTEILSAPNEAHVQFGHGSVIVKLRYPTSKSTDLR